MSGAERRQETVFVAKFVIRLPSLDDKEHLSNKIIDTANFDIGLRSDEVDKIVDEKTVAFERIVGSRGHQLFMEWEREKVSLCAAIDSCFNKDIEIRTEAHAIRELFESSSRAVTTKLMAILSAHTDNSNNSVFVRDIQNTFADDDNESCTVSASHTRFNEIGEENGSSVQGKDIDDEAANTYVRSWSKRNRREFDAIFTSSSNQATPALSFKPFVVPTKKSRPISN